MRDWVTETEMAELLRIHWANIEALESISPALPLSVPPGYNATIPTPIDLVIASMHRSNMATLAHLTEIIELHPF
jgi:hypothetical protein